MVICPDCGKEVPKDKFCKNCGAYLADIEEVEVSETPSTDMIESDGVKSLTVNNQQQKIKFCYNCGAELTGNFKFCPECGQDLSSNIASSNKPAIVAPREKNTLLAVILSVLLPGLGQIYLGLDNKGAIFLIAYVISAILVLFIIGIVLVIILWIWALVDTIISANALSRGDSVEDKLF